MNLKPLLVIGALAGIVYYVLSSNKAFAQTAPVLPPNMRLSNLYKQIMNMTPQQTKQFFSKMSETEYKTFMESLDPQEATMIQRRLIAADEEEAK